MEAVILAGGLGTRLSKVLNGVPKAMAPVRGRPFLELLFGRLERGGFERIILSVGYLHHVIQQHFGSRYGRLNLEYAIEQSPLGTGGAVCIALARTSGERAFVLNGDSLVALDYRAMYQNHVASRARFSMAVCQMEDTSRYGRVLVDRDVVVGFLEKQDGSGRGLINAGVYLMEHDLLSEHALGEVFSLERDYLPPRLEVLKPVAFRTAGPFIDIGVPEDYERAQHEVLGPS